MAENINTQAADIKAADIKATDIPATDIPAADIKATDVRAKEVRATDVRNINIPDMDWANDSGDRSGLEPELGGVLRETQNRSGLEPELGGRFRQTGVYVDELTCIGCTHCAHVARNTFYIEPDYGRARVIRQEGDSADLIQEAIDTCPVDCIHRVDYTELRQLERDRQHQIIPIVGFPAERAVAAVQRRRLKAMRKTTSNQSLNPSAKSGL